MSEAAASSGFGSNGAALRVLSDDRLARRAVSGDERAFAAIFRRHHQSLYRFCLAIVGNSEDAQDALQNTMVKVLRALPGEERQIQLKPWLYRIAHNESIELIRRRRDTRQLPPELAAPGSGLAEEAASRERLRRLISDMDELPERQREALIMRELAGLDFSEIGAALGTSASVARQTLYEARRSLRQMDEGREMGCESVTRALSDGDGRVSRRRDLRAHLRACAGCRRFREEIGGRKRDFAGLSPLPAAAAAGLLHGLLGGHGAGAEALAGALGGGAAQTLGASAALKARRPSRSWRRSASPPRGQGGLIDAGGPGQGGSQPAQVAGPTIKGPATRSSAGSGRPATAAAAQGRAGRRAHLGSAQAQNAASTPAPRTPAAEAATAAAGGLGPPPRTRSVVVTPSCSRAPPPKGSSRRRPTKRSTQGPPEVRAMSRMRRSRSIRRSRPSPSRKRKPRLPRPAAAGRERTRRRPLRLRPRATEKPLPPTKPASSPERTRARKGLTPGALSRFSSRGRAKREIGPDGSRPAAFQHQGNAKRGPGTGRHEPKEAR
ncbi:MAG: RNA polymerase sigma factor [Solirubrobacterales bacterium]